MWKDDLIEGRQKRVEEGIEGGSRCTRICIELSKNKLNKSETNKITWCLWWELSLINAVDQHKS